MTAQQSELEKRIADAEGAEAAILFPSFEDALTKTMQVFLHDGDHLLASSAVSDAAKQVFASNFGIQVETTFIAPSEPRRWRQEVRKNTRAMFVRNPINSESDSQTDKVDIAPMKLLAGSRGLILIIDSTLSLPNTYRPLEHDADILVHSCTRYQGKLGDTQCGVVAGARQFIDEVRRKTLTSA